MQDVSRSTTKPEAVDFFHPPLIGEQNLAGDIIMVSEEGDQGSSQARDSKNSRKSSKAESFKQIRDTS